MKAITLYEPWASLFGPMNEKEFETRSWPTDYRGWLAVHASKNAEYLYLCTQEPFRSVLAKRGLRPGDLKKHLGCILAVGKLVDCMPTRNVRSQLTPQEAALGDFSNGRYAWKRGLMIPLPEPIPVRGMQRLWDVPPEVVQNIREQVKAMRSTGASLT